MNANQRLIVVLFALCLLFIPAQAAQAQTNEVYQGTIISFNGPRTGTANFTLRINGRTSDESARQYLSALREDGQNEALDAIRKQDLGSFSVNNNIGRTINVVRESVVDGRRRIFVVFERWQQFAELRGGYRSVDYPFGVIELFIDENTGKGEGTYIAAARIRYDRDSRTNQEQVEIENFATYPAKLTAVTSSNRKK